MEEIRMIVFQEGSYQLLKPKENGGWHKYGQRKSLKAIYDTIASRKYKLMMSKDTIKDLEEYEKQRELQRKKYRRGLVNKVIRIGR